MSLQETDYSNPYGFINYDDMNPFQASENQQDETNLISFDDSQNQSDQSTDSINTSEASDTENISQNKNDKNMKKSIKKGFTKAFKFADNVSSKCTDKVSHLHSTHAISKAFGKMCHAVDSSTVNVVHFIKDKSKKLHIKNK